MVEEDCMHPFDSVDSRVGLQVVAVLLGDIQGSVR